MKRKERVLLRFSQIIDFAAKKNIMKVAVCVIGLWVNDNRRQHTGRGIYAGKSMFITGTDKGKNIQRSVRLFREWNLACVLFAGSE